MFSPATTICEARAAAVRFSLGFETGGEDFNSRFFSFDEEPFAAASIAQVHHALLRDHQEVAVKVQYPGLEYQMKFDLATMSFLSKSVAWPSLSTPFQPTQPSQNTAFGFGNFGQTQGAAANSFGTPNAFGQSNFLQPYVETLLYYSSAETKGQRLKGDDDWKPEPFDFLIGGELIRMSLEEFLLAKKISAEKILDIEYIKAVAPRREEEPSLHDHWVSVVDGSNSKCFRWW